MTVDNKPLPAIPAKRYFTIGEVSELCGVKAYVLRYWEQEFTQLKPMKRRGNRRYYQHHEVLLIRRIRDLLYEQGFTISGARNQLTDAGASHAHAAAAAGRAVRRRTSSTTRPSTTPSRPRRCALAQPPRATRGTRTRVRDRPQRDRATLDDAALEAMARDDLAIIERAQRGVGEFAHAGRARARDRQRARRQRRRARRRAADAPRRAHGQQQPAAVSHGELSTPDQIRAELLAIRALLVS